MTMMLAVLLMCVVVPAWAVPGKFTRENVFKNIKIFKISECNIVAVVYTCRGRRMAIINICCLK